MLKMHGVQLGHSDIILYVVNSICMMSVIAVDFLLVSRCSLNAALQLLWQLVFVCMLAVQPFGLVVSSLSMLY